MKKLFITLIIIIAILVNIVCSTYYCTSLLSFENIEALAKEECFNSNIKCTEVGTICFYNGGIYFGITMK